VARRLFAMRNIARSSSGNEALISGDRRDLAHDVVLL